jgi:hypothetical protein
MPVDHRQNMRQSTAFERERRPRASAACAYLASSGALHRRTLKKA